MNPPEALPAGLTPESLHRLLAAAERQVEAALWLSAGMLCAFAMIGCVALGWRRAALVAGLGYALTLCFVPNGHAQILGPIGSAIALTGLIWPRQKGRSG